MAGGLLGFLRRAAGGKSEAASTTKAATSMMTAGGIWQQIFGPQEPFTGAWQRNMEQRQTPELLRNSAVFACVARISQDVAKLPWRIQQIDDNGIWADRPGSPYGLILRYQNDYQTPLQFREALVASLLLSGNAYVLKVMDGRNMVSEAHVLNPALVRPMVSHETGEVFYQINPDPLVGLFEPVTVPARYIVHVRINCLFSPLVGLSPLYAAALAASQGKAITELSSVMFQNGARPGGVLELPGAISQEQADQLKKHFETGYTGNNSGRIAVLSNGAKFTALATKATDNQLVEQLNWSAVDVARAFGVPAYKIEAGPRPSYQTVAAADREYFNQTIHYYVCVIEQSLTRGFLLPEGMRINLDEMDVSRMDPAARFEMAEKMQETSTLNEARRMIGLPPIEGGDTVYKQQQEYSVEALARRDAAGPPPSKIEPEQPENEGAAPGGDEIPDDEAAKALEIFSKTMGARDAA